MAYRPRKIELMTDDEVVAELKRYNPFGQYVRPSSNDFKTRENEQRVLRETLARYQGGK